MKKANANEGILVAGSETVGDGLLGRREVFRVLSASLTPLGALAIAAESSVATWSALAFRTDAQRRHMRPKFEGNTFTMLWTELTREWLAAAQVPGLRIHDPHSWVELIVHDAVHVRMHRERRPNTATDRGMRWNEQLSLADLGPGWTLREPTKVDLEMVPGPTGRLEALTVRSILGKVDRFTPIEINLTKARQQLVQWQRRSVPWLDVADRFSVSGVQTLRPAQPEVTMLEGRPVPPYAFRPIEKPGGREAQRDSDGGR